MSWRSPSALTEASWRTPTPNAPRVCPRPLVGLALATLGRSHWPDPPQVQEAGPQ